METFRNRYRIASARCPGWDYRTPGLYHVTVCTAERQPRLSAVDADGHLRLSRLGHLATVHWHALAVAHASVAVEAFVAMPDHVHALVRLAHEAPSLSTLVQHAKGGVTREARALGWLGAEPLWQPRFHDRIVRTEAHARAIRAYLRDNPIRWARTHAPPP